MSAAGRRVFGFALAALMLAVAVPDRASAQVSCGNHKEDYWIRQPVACVASIEWVSRTSRSFNVCPLEVQAEGWVNGLGSARVARSTYVAEVRVTQSVPSFKTWTMTTKHWLIWNWGLTWTYLGTNGASAAVTGCSSSSSCDLNQAACPDGTEFQSWRCQCVTLSPILIDTAGDGYRLTSADEGVVFDLDANGHALERVAWTEADSDDAWLVLDRNANGVIDSGAELFGSKTPAYANERTPTAANGFVALAFAEGPSYGPGLADGVIDARDAVFSQLRLWFDRNQNGVSDPGELVPLADAGIVSLGTTYQETAHRDRHGNMYSLKGRAVFAGPQGQEINRPIYDVFLTVAGAPPANTAQSRTER